VEGSRALGSGFVRHGLRLQKALRHLRVGLVPDPRDLLPTLSRANEIPGTKIQASEVEVDVRVPGAERACALECFDPRL
jgi:hypothetical protein